MWNKPLEVLGVGCGLFGRKTDCGCSQFDARGLRDAASPVKTADREPLKGYDLRRVFHLGWADAGAWINTLRAVPRLSMKENQLGSRACSPKSRRRGRSIDMLTREMQMLGRCSYMGIQPWVYFSR